MCFLNGNSKTRVLDALSGIYQDLDMHRMREPHKYKETHTRMTSMGITYVLEFGFIARC